MRTFPQAEKQEHPRDHQNFRMENLQRQQQEATPTEKRFLKALHWMRCPKCGHALATERHGSVNIDYCPDCRGAWLDIPAFEAIIASDNDFLRSCLRNLHRERYTNHQLTTEL